MPKLLDFSDYKNTRNRISSIEVELEFRKIEGLYSQTVNQYFLELSSIIFPIPNVSYSNHLRLSGGRSDGGYAISADLNFCQKWITAGLGSHIDFETELANHGCSVFGVDMNIGKFRNLNRNLTLTKKFWGKTDSGQELTLSSMYSQARIGKEDTWGFKFDIEGNEWNLMGQIDSLDNPPSFIACELHNLVPNSRNLDSLDQKLEVIKLFSEKYSPVFSKGNNYSAHVIHGGISLYDVLEMSWVRKDKMDEFILNSNPEPKNLYFPNDATQPLFEIGRLT
jgi:hypothetical protein